MCLKQEDQYDHCFDFMFIDGGFEKTLPMYLWDEFGMEVVKLDVFEKRIKDLLEQMHDAGIVRPVQSGIGIGDPRFACPTCDRMGWISQEQLQKVVKQ